MIFDYHDNPVNCVLKDKKDSLCALIEGTEDMQLSNKTVLGPERLGVNATATYYKIGNNRYSRKAYEAIVKGNLEWQQG